MPRMSVTGFVLAGGRSTRMGRDKALLDWHGQTLVDHMLNLLRSVADEVHVVGRAPLPDERPGLGPLSGIATGLERSSTDANIFVAVDLPHLTQEFLKYLRLQLENSHHVMLACKIGSDFPLCLGIRQPVLPEIKRRLANGQWSVRGVIKPARRKLSLKRSCVARASTLPSFKTSILLRITNGNPDAFADFPAWPRYV